MVANVRELLIRHEGSVPHAYQDSLGLWTIGVGHLIDQKKGGALPQPIIDQLLDYDIDAHTRALFSDLPWVAQLDAVRQAVLIDMHFNLGQSPARLQRHAPARPARRVGSGSNGDACQSLGGASRLTGPSGWQG
jgi:GH24 family phage-related lysozyme (muramidase)